MNNIEKSFGEIVRGSSLIFVGKIIYLFLSFITITLIARFLTKHEYGTFQLAFTVFSIASILSSIGLPDGVVRFISFYRSRNEKMKVYGTIISSLKISLFSSIFTSIIIYIFSGDLSIFFNNSELSTVLRIFALTLPFFVLLNILISIFRGFRNIKIKVYFQDIAINILRILFVLTAIYIGGSLIYISFAFVLPIFIVTGWVVVYSLKQDFWHEGEKLGKELLLFSIPLLMQGVLNMFLSWTDTIMLGYFSTSESVGLYNVAVPIAKLLSIGLTSMVFIYLPVASQLYAQNNIAEIRRLYTLVTKWVVIITLPAFFLFFLFPKTSIFTFFGEKYISASLALQILSLGFLIEIIFGPNFATLIVVGKSRMIMISSLIGGFINLVLNFYLIPIYGITGAALATTLSLIIFNILVSTQLYVTYKITPISRKYIEILFTSSIFIIIISIFITDLFSGLILFAISFLLFIFIMIASLVLTKSIDMEDINLLLLSVEQIGIDTKKINKILRKLL